MGFDSTPGGGSRSWFTVGLARGDDAASRPVEANHDLAGLRALVVVDDDTTRQLLDRTLRQWGMEPTTASSGEQALELMRSATAAGETYDVAILDHQAPRMDGVALARAIGEDPALHHPPLVLLSSSGARRDVGAPAEAGMHAFVTKPVEAHALHEALSAVTPLEGRAAPIAPPLSRFTLVATESRSRAHILVVDDNVVSQKVTARFLEKLGYRPDVAANASEAVAAVATTHYDAVLMDCQVPETDGWEATRAIRALEAGRPLPVIAMGPGARGRERERCLAVGMDDFLSKPVRIDALAETLERWLGQGGDGAIALLGYAQPTLDEKAIAQVRDVDPGGFRELVVLFVAHAGADLARLRAAIGAEDGFEVWGLANAVEGSSATIGAARLALLSSHLDGAVGDWERARAIVDRMEDELVAVRTALMAEADGTTGDLAGAAARGEGGGRDPMGALAPILVVEGDPVAATLVRRHLSTLGLANPVRVATDGEGAIASLSDAVAGASADLPALILLDRRLPRLGGLDVLRWIHAQPALRSVPVVMLATDADLDGISEAYALGAWSHLVKPIGFDVLADAVRDLTLRWAMVPGGVDHR